MMLPREVLIYTPPGGEFYRADYPWLRAVRASVRGGDGGAAADGTPGEPGEFVSVLLAADEIPPRLRIEVARGGRGAPGASDGEPGIALLELYDDDPS